MRRLLATLRLDVIKQFRNGFYFVGAFTVVVFVTLFHQLAAWIGAGQLLLVPGLVVLNLVVTTFYFVGALVLLEKEEGVLAGLVVSPLRDTEYLAAKIASLTGLALVETLLIVGLIFGIHFGLLLFLAALLLLGGIYVLAGFVAIARYDSINEYLLPSVLVVTLLALPLLDHFGLWRSVLIYLHPVQPALVLLRASYGAGGLWEVVYGLVGSLVWYGLLFVWARRIFHRFVVRPAGG